MVLENIKKVAVLQFDESNEKTQFLHLDQCRPLAAIIKDLCDAWGMSEPDDYSLQFTDHNKNAFITERNRVEIRNGDILRLTYSPAKTAHEIVSKLKAEEKAQQYTSLQQLASFASDVTFAQEYIGKQGLERVLNIVENDCPMDMVGFALQAFVELMEHNIVSWDILESKFIKVVAGLVKVRNTNLGGGPSKITTLKAALEILESIVLHSTGRHPVLEQEITPMILLQHIESPNQDIQKNAIALVSALFSKAPPEKKKEMGETLQSKTFRNVILEKVIHRQQGQVGPGMAAQLAQLQTQVFSLLEERMNTPVDPNSQSAMREVTELRRVAFDVEQETSPSSSRKATPNSQDWIKLGFDNPRNPLEDFTVTPPGKLALENMSYFARNHAENYTRVVLENSCRSDKYDCPFAKASISMTNLLCEILKVGEASDESSTYHPMFFTHDHPFEEFFCICMHLLNKTWKEMRATSVDFTKVMSVVKEQITRALESQPTTFDKLRTKLQEITYRKITELWDNERQHKEEWESQAKPVVELRQQLKPEIEELIKQQRLNYLVEGTRFNKYSSRGAKRNDKYMYWRLAPNHKVFHYGDCEEDNRPSVEELPNKLPVVDIKSIDKDRLKGTGRKANMSKLAFTIQCEENTSDKDSFSFVAPSQNDYDMWIDGINALLGVPMKSDLYNNDLEILLGMEIKLRLLDTEGVTIPENPPPIPPEPSNYDFACD